MKKALFLSAACVFGIPVAASAQDATPMDAGAAASDEAGTADAEIIVTAQGRKQSAMSVPIAITAIGAEALGAAGVSDVRTLTQVTPTLAVTGTTSESKFSARIRGIGTSTGDFGLESSVALFVDGVYRSRSGMGMTDLGEIERVEVLRGPQGTLFGRNSTAGAINIVTKSPSFEFGGQAAATYGNYDYMRLDGGVTGPISEALAFRIDGSWQKRDGFMKNVTPGEPDLADRDRWMVRGQLLVEPSDALSVRLIGDYMQRDENCCAFAFLNPVQNIARGANGDLLFSPNNLMPIYQALGANAQLAPAGQRVVRRVAGTPGAGFRADSKDWGVSGEVNWDIGSVHLTSITAYRDYIYHQGSDPDFSFLDLVRIPNRDPHFRTFTQEVRLNGKAFSDRLDWLVGGFYGNEKLNTFDTIRYGADAEKWLNCVSVAGSAALAPTLNINSPTCSNAPTSAWGGLQGFAAQLGANRINNTGALGNIFRQRTENYAFFTHNVLQIIPDKLSLTVGARYTHERKAITSVANMNNDLCTKMVNSPLQGSARVACLINSLAPSLTSADPGTSITDSQWTGTAVLTFHPTDNLMLYASWARGFKSGGYTLDVNGFDVTCSASAGTPAQNAACAALRALPANTKLNGRAEAADLQYGAEKVTAYELGAKWRGDGISLTGALFLQRFNDFQVSAFNGVSFEVSSLNGCKDDLGTGPIDNNAATGACAPDRLKPGVISKGVELEAELRPAPDLTFNLGFTYVNARFAKDLVGTGGRALAPQLFQYPGRHTNGSPYTVTAAVNWTPEISSRLNAIVYMDYRYSSEDTSLSGDFDLEKQMEGYGLLNGRIGLQTPDKRWSVELWAQNLLNKKYWLQGSDALLLGSGTTRSVQAGPALGFAATANQVSGAFLGDPRTYGLTVKTRF